jgi:GT2 family glycosyltransferase
VAVFTRSQWTAGAHPPHSRLPGVSVIISSRNRPSLLYDTVLSILEGAEIPAELVVIDQSDLSHPTLQKLRSIGGCELRYIWNPSAGVSRGRNAGIAAASHDVLAFTDDDVRVTPNWLSSLVGALIERGPATIVTGRVSAEDHRASHFVGAVQLGDAPVIYRGRVGVDVLASGNMAARREDLLAVGGFDVRLGPGTSFPAAEDSDLGFRLLEAGCAIVYEPRALLYHRAWRPIGDYLSIRWAYGQGKGAYYAKHLRVRDPHMLRRLLEQALRRTSRAMRWIWREPRRGIGELLFVIGLLEGFSEWLLTQRSAR